MMAFYTEEWDQIVGGGEEFSEPVTLLYEDQSFAVNAIYSEGWSRKEVDGRLTTDEPLMTRTLTIAKSAIPSIVAKENYGAMRFIVEDTLYGVLKITGKDPLIVYLTAKEASPVADTVVGDDDEALGSDVGDVGTSDPEIAEDW
jgi:hypothetical protein